METQVDRHVAIFKFIQKIRDFFNERDFMDVVTPPMVQNPGMEVHIHPFKIASLKRELPPLYLHTSPEFHMKELLSLGLGNIFTINYCFRDEPESPQHRPQFLMLEWYRKNSHYKDVMLDCQELLSYLSPNGPAKVERKTIQELFFEILNIDILEYLEIESIRDLIKNQFKDIPIPNEGESLNWDDYFFLLFLNKIESKLKNYPFLILDEFPYPLAALSTRKNSDKRVCERFELYINGVEIGNCFNELTDYDEQEKRFLEQAQMKKDLYQIELPKPEILLDSLKRGLPSSSGIAVGVERLFSALFHKEAPFWK
jgi:lysyl-tRNA synthetase class 2